MEHGLTKGMKWPSGNPFMGYKDRALTRFEKQIALDVFHESLPDFSRIRISDGIGLGNRPWTRASEWLPFADTVWVLNLGARGFSDTSTMKDTLVHELVHVWQGYHSIFESSFMLKSFLSQAKVWTSAYKYTPGKKWSDYNVEQKAEIVEDWYENGMRKTEADPLFPYIKNHIWAGVD